MASPGQPILFCFDGSEESRRSLGSVSNLLASTSAVVLTVWQPLVARLGETGGFGVFALQDESSIDDSEREAASRIAEEGAAAAREIGFDASARVEEATTAVWSSVVDVADEIDAGLIVCGTRGRGAVRNALLGSVSRAVLQHAGRPVLISPDPRHSD